MKKQLQITALAAAGIAFPVLASAILISEDFDNLGTLQGTLGSVAAGTYTDVGTTPAYYIPGLQLTYNSAGYVNTGLSGATHGAAISTSVMNTNASANHSTRALSGLGSTVWMSFLVLQSQVSGGDVSVLYLNDFNDIRLGIQSGKISLRWGGATNERIETTDVTAFTTNLIVGKFETDYDGTNDRVTAWLNPNTSSLTEAGLGTADILQEGMDLWTGEFTKLGIAFRTTVGAGGEHLIDAIRISDQLQPVLTGAVIPEPSTYAMLLGALALAGVVIRRRMR